MARLLFLLGIAAVVLYIFALVDCAMSDEHRVRGVPKVAWIFIIILAPVIGSIMWFVFGRGEKRQPMPARSMAPDDDPHFLDQLGWKREQEERIRRLEQELSKLDDDPDTDKPKRPDA